MTVEKKITHTTSWTPYNGNNPNNCTHCCVASSNWKFTPVDEFDNTHCLCNNCISTGAIHSLGMKVEAEINSLTRFNHN